MKQKQKSWSKILRVVLHVFLMALFLFAIALILAWFVQYRYLGDDADFTWEFFLDNPGLYWYSVLIIGLILAFLSAIMRPFLAAGMTSIIIIGLMFANQYKLAVQHVPLLPEDLQMTGQAGELTKFVDGGHLARTIIVMILILGLSIFLTILVYRHHFDKNLPWWRRHALIQRVVLAIVAGIGLNNALNALIEQANQAHQGQPAEWMGITEFIDYEQVTNYDNLGFVSGFIYNLRSSKIDEPTGYDETKIRTLAMRYNGKQNEGNAERTDLHDTVDKIIIILDESFYDPSILDDYYPHTGGDVTPNLHQITSKYPHGYMYSPGYGGGTANIEYEVDTGLTNYWSNTIPFSDIVPYINQIPSVANTAKKAGFYTAALHSFNGSLYKRSIALPKEGFMDFFTDQDLSYTKVDPWEPYVNDYSAYHETFDRIKNSDKQLFKIITMQNHAPYPTREYEDLDFMPISSNDSSSDPIEDDTVARYYQSLHASDQAVGDFLKALNSTNERTVVLLYGDHAGGVFSHIVASDDSDVKSLAYQTPYFVYANFDLKTDNLELPMTSPNCLVNTMYNVLNVKKPAFNYLLDDVCKDEPILTRTYLQDREFKKTEALEAYELINYDITNGQQYWMKYANE